MCSQDNLSPSGTNIQAGLPATEEHVIEPLQLQLATSAQVDMDVEGPDSPTIVSVEISASSAAKSLQLRQPIKRKPSSNLLPKPQALREQTNVMVRGLRRPR